MTTLKSILFSKVWLTDPSLPGEVHFLTKRREHCIQKMLNLITLSSLVWLLSFSRTHANIEAREMVMRGRQRDLYLVLYPTSIQIVFSKTNPWEKERERESKNDMLHTRIYLVLVLFSDIQAAELCWRFCHSGHFLWGSLLPLHNFLFRSMCQKGQERKVQILQNILGCFGVLYVMLRSCVYSYVYLQTHAHWSCFPLPQEAVTT